MMLTAYVRTSDTEIPSKDETDPESDMGEVFSKEVFSDLTHYELTYSLLEILERHELLKI